jgi:cell division protein FtsL
MPEDTPRTIYLATEVKRRDLPRSGRFAKALITILLFVAVILSVSALARFLGSF